MSGRRAARAEAVAEEDGETEKPEEAGKGDGVVEMEEGSESGGGPQEAGLWRTRSGLQKPHSQEGNGRAS